MTGVQTCALPIFWPFLFSRASASFLHGGNGLWLSLTLSILAVFLLAQQVSAQLLDSKVIAIIGILAAVISSLRLLGAGAIGIEPI